MKAAELWEQQFAKLVARKGALHFQAEQLGRELALVDKQIAALDTTKELAAGIDAGAGDTRPGRNGHAEAEQASGADLSES